MIHYHGTPISGSDPEKFLLGRHALVPFMYQTHLEAVMECCQSFVLDNSAFSYWRKGGTLDVPAYYRWVKALERHPNLDWCLIPDKIDGNEKENMRMVQDWRNLRLKVKSVPVWHLHESLEYLDWLCKTFDTVALGSSGEWTKPGAKSWWTRINEAMAVACDEDGRPVTKLHGLRMLDPKIFTRLPLSSADSTNAGTNAGSVSRFGIYVPTTGGRRPTVIADRIEIHNSAQFYVFDGDDDEITS